MEMKWVEDFLSVAETLNFTLSARLRHVTQPAFSRRIRALENWLGAELFDRASYPTQLTPAGKLFLVQAREMLEHTLYSRAMLRGQVADAQGAMQFAMPHTLSLTYFPKWLSEIEKVTGMMAVRLEASNVHDAVMALVDGNCDLMLSYHHAYQSMELDSRRYAMLEIGSESIRPYAKADARGRPIYSLPGSAGKPLPFLCYSSSAALGRVVEKILNECAAPVHLFRRFETDLAEGLKMMAIQGHGIAWLPGSAVAQELADGKLALAIDAELAGDADTGTPWCADMKVCIYRDRERRRPLLDRLWNHLARSHPQRVERFAPPRANLSQVSVGAPA